MTTEAIWLQRVLDWRSSGYTAEAFCVERGLSVGALHTWSSRLGRAGKVTPSARGRRRRVGSEPIQFTAVRAVAEQPAPAERRAAPETRSGGIVVTIGDARVEISVGFDPTLLRAVVATLSGGRR